jgi:hypothetical protein
MNANGSANKKRKFDPLLAKASWVPVMFRMEQGIPVQRYKKELIKVGNYVKDSDGIEFEVTPEMIDHWNRVISLELSNGLKIPVPVGHTTNAEMNRGWMVDSVIEGDSLFGIVDLVGEDAIALAGRCDVSIYSPPKFTDGHGNVYQYPILHVALCTDPVVPGLGEFVAISASHLPTLILENITMADINAPAAPAPAAPAPSGSVGDAIRGSFREVLNAIIDDTTLDDKAIFSKIKDVLKARSKALGIVEPVAETVAPDPAVMSASLSKATESSPMLIQLTRKSRKQDLEALVVAGKITPAARDKLAAQWITSDDAALSLNITASGMAQFDNLISALSENAAVSLGEKTKAQTLSLSSPLKEGEDRFDKTMKAAAGIK